MGHTGILQLTTKKARLYSVKAQKYGLWDQVYKEAEPQIGKLSLIVLSNSEGLKWTINEKNILIHCG